MPAVGALRLGRGIWIRVWAHDGNVMYKLHKVKTFLLKVANMLLILDEGYSG
jgi:hypothetical protein